MGHIVVVGEALLDVDLVGVTHRLCPDAPVPVIDDITEHARPGGAALAAAMIARLGHQVSLLTPLGADAGAEAIGTMLAGQVDVTALPHEGETPSKRRIRVGEQAVARLDAGGRAAPWQEVSPQVLDRLAGSDAVLVADYGRGLTRDALVRTLLADVAARTPLVWDPHPAGGEPVAGCRVMTPNEAELLAGSADLHAIARRAEALTATLRVGAVAVTLGRRGALLSYGRSAPQFFATTPVNGDSCGAGDCFAAMLTASIAEGSLLPVGVQRAVAAATSHVEHGGAAAFGTRTPARLAHDAVRVAAQAHAEGRTVVAAGGCFDLLHAGHVTMLQAAAQLGDRLIVCLNSDDSVRRIKGPERPLTPAADRKRILESLQCVDAVEIFTEDTPHEALRRLRPDVWVKGGDYAGSELPEQAILAEWGGQSLILPYLAGRSTTGLVDAMSAH